jgi:hypothetical protein
MTNTIKVLLQMQNGFLQLESTLCTVAINFARQGHSLTQSKMLHCKTVVNIITYHHVV